MAEASSGPCDPYQNFTFRVRWGASAGYVAGVSKVSALTRTAERVKSLDGGDLGRPHPSPESTEHEAITLERGLTLDPEFVRWARQGANLGPQLSSAVEPEGLRQDLRLEVFDEAGQPVLAYTLFRCRVSEFHALADPDAQANVVVIERIRLENEGWERVC